MCRRGCRSPQAACKTTAGTVKMNAIDVPVERGRQFPALLTGSGMNEQSHPGDRQARQQHCRLQDHSVIQDGQLTDDPRRQKSLFAVGMNLQATAAMAEAADVADRIAYAVDELDRVIKELRNYIFGLRSQLSARLDDALRRLASDFQERSGVLTIVEIDVDIAADLQRNAS